MVTAVHTTTSSLSEARRIARVLAEPHRRGCGRIRAVAQAGQDPEFHLVVRCADGSGGEVVRLIREHHTYAEPKIWTETVEAVSPDFLHWVEKHSRGHP